MTCLLYWNKVSVPFAISLRTLIKTLKKETSPGSSLKFRFTSHRAGLLLKDMELRKKDDYDEKHTKMLIKKKSTMKDAYHL